MTAFRYATQGVNYLGKRYTAVSGDIVIVRCCALLRPLERKPRIHGEGSHEALFLDIHGNHESEFYGIRVASA